MVKENAFFTKVNELRSTGAYIYNSHQVAKELNRSHEEIFLYIMNYAKKERIQNDADTLELFIPHFSHDGPNPSILHFDVTPEGYEILAYIDFLRTEYKAHSKGRA